MERGIDVEFECAGPWRRSHPEGGVVKSDRYGRRG